MVYIPAVTGNGRPGCYYDLQYLTQRTTNEIPETERYRAILENTRLFTRLDRPGLNLSN